MLLRVAPRPQGTSGKGRHLCARLVNSSEEVLAAFKTYYETAELQDVTDPNLVYDLRAKLDASGHYDEFEVDRVATVEMNPNAKQSDLVAALEPVVDHLLKRFRQAQEQLRGRTQQE
jgi:type I restriction enzyme R subunit